MTAPPAVPETPKQKALAGIVLMLTATLLFALMHVMIRYVSSGLHAFEIAFFRNVFGLLVVLPFLIRHGLQPLRTRRLPMHLLRASFNVFAMLLGFYALTAAPLAEVTALGFAAPVFACVLAIPIMGEAVGLRRWLAIVLGFAGTLVVLRPGFAEIGAGQLAAVTSALAWACALLVIKSLGRTESSVTIIAYMGLLLMPLSLIPALLVWTGPSLRQLAWLAAIGVTGSLAQLSMTESLKRGDASLVLPIDFFKLIWVALLAWLVFGEIPDVFTWLGGAIIFLSTLYITLRERTAGAAAPPPRPAAPR